MELNFTDPTLTSIVQDVYNSEQLEVFADDLINKYSLTREQFEEYMLHLEFSFVCCLGYKKIDDQWHEKVTPFHEWKEYITFLKTSEITSSVASDKVALKRPADFSFVQDLGALLEKAKKQAVALEKTEMGYLIPQKKILSTLAISCGISNLEEENLCAYFDHLITKAQMIRLIESSEKKITLTDKAMEWLDMRLESRAMYLYRHPINKPILPDECESLCNEKSLREAEKSIARVIGKDWVLFDDFMKGVYSTLRDDQQVSLKRYGRVWKYALPEYSASEELFLKQVVLQWLFEAGIVQVGQLEGKDCFRVTTLGASLFAR